MKTGSYKVIYTVLNGEELKTLEAPHKAQFEVGEYTEDALRAKWQAMVDAQPVMTINGQDVVSSKITRIDIELDTLSNHAF